MKTVVWIATAVTGRKRLPYRTALTQPKRTPRTWLRLLGRTEGVATVDES